jgi:hypothetical protein
MTSLTDVLLSVDFLKIALPAAGAITAWFLNERSKIRSEQLQRKEERYKELLRCLKGFYVGRQDSDLKSQFVEQVKLCWLYAPDDVVKKQMLFSRLFTRSDSRQRPMKKRSGLSRSSS